MKKKLFWALPETVWLHHKPPDKDYRIVKYNQHGKIFIMYIKKPGPNLQTKADVISQLHRTSWVENQRKTVRKAEKRFPRQSKFHSLKDKLTCQIKYDDRPFWAKLLLICVIWGDFFDHYHWQSFVQER